MRSAWAFVATMTNSVPSGAGNAAITLSPGLRPMTGLPFAVPASSSAEIRFTTPLAVISAMGRPSASVASVSTCSPVCVEKISEIAAPRERPVTSETVAAGDTSARPAFVMAITLLNKVVSMRDTSTS